MIPNPAVALALAGGFGAERARPRASLSRARLARIRPRCRVGPVLKRKIRLAQPARVRYAKAIALQPACVTCHGSAESIPGGVQASLQAEYPLDTATGYRVGGLRGAIVIRRPLCQ